MLWGNLGRRVIHMNKYTMIMANTFVLIAFALAGGDYHNQAGCRRCGFIASKRRRHDVRLR